MVFQRTISVSRGTEWSGLESSGMKSFLTALLFGVAAFAQMQAIGPNETFASAKLLPTEVREIIAGVDKSAYDTPDSWENELRVRRVDLGSSPGLVVRGTNLLCGATGNCQIWVFRSVNGHWVSLFGNDAAPLADGFKLGPDVTLGIKNFTLSTNRSANREKPITYKFDGNLFRAK